MSFREQLAWSLAAVGALVLFGLAMCLEGPTETDARQLRPLLHEKQMLELRLEIQQLRQKLED